MTIDFVDMPPLSGHVADAVRRLFRGDAAAEPELTAADFAALDDHGLIPLLYARGRWPSLRGRAVAAAVEEAFRLRELREVLEALHERSVVPLILKGTALAYSIYAAPEQRPRSDTDLLVREGDLPAVREVLLRRGFGERPTSGDTLGVRQYSFSRAEPEGVEHVLDIHLAISNSAVFADLLGYDELFGRSGPVAAIAPCARGLSIVDALLLACIHRVAHHYDSERLIWLHDVHLLRERMSAGEHAEFWRMAAERRVVAVASRAIDLAGEWFATAVRHRAEDHLDPVAMARAEPSRAFLDRGRSRAALLAGDLAALPGWRHRARRLWQLAFPPPSFIRQTSGAPLPLAYLWRAVRGVGRLFRRVAD